MSQESDYKLALKLQNDFDSEFASNIRHFEDISLATQLQQQENRNVINNEKTYQKIPPNEKAEKCNLANESWEMIDPTPDAWALFVEFDKKYFWGKLAGVEVSWSSRMTRLVDKILFY